MHLFNKDTPPSKWLHCFMFPYNSYGRVRSNYEGASCVLVCYPTINRKGAREDTKTIKLSKPRLWGLERLSVGEAPTTPEWRPEFRSPALT